MEEPFIEINAEDFIITPFDTHPIEGYEIPTNEMGEELPYCCTYHKDLYNKAIIWFDKFPNCCAKHKKIAARNSFIKTSYNDVPLKIVKQVSYTEHHIRARIETEDWYSDITEYIDYNFTSFGHPPIGIEKYYSSILHFVKNQKNFNIPNVKKHILIEFLEAQNNTSSKESVKTSLNVLHSVYQKWLKAFPFELSFFKTLKEQFINKLPIIDGKIVHNRYSRLSKGKALTPSKLIESLIETTNELLKKVNTAELLEKGIISDKNKHLIEVVSELHKIKQTSLLGKYTETEIKYITVLKSWLTNEKEYFKEISELLKNQFSEQKEYLPTKKSLRLELNKYRFLNLPAVVSLTTNSQEKLYGLIDTNNIPYQIALLDHIDFIKHLKNQYVTSNEKLFKEIATLLNTNERTVKGNIYVLNEISKEDRKRYTAHLHKEQASRDYQSLK